VFKEMPPAGIPPEALLHALRGVAQAQAVPQLHCVPQAQPSLAARVWQPQVQPASGQFWQVQSDSICSFMSFSLVRG
jgi:hypothetical protein